MNYIISNSQSPRKHHKLRSIELDDRFDAFVILQEAVHREMRILDHCGNSKQAKAIIKNKMRLH